MPDGLEKFLSDELAELKHNKVRAGAMGACLSALIIFAALDGSSGEEISLEETPVTEDLPARILPAARSPDGVTPISGAEKDALLIADPFVVEEKIAPPSRLELEPELPQVPEVAPIVEVQPPPEVAPPKEEFLLTGTAISGDVKVAMFLRGGETLFLTIGEELGGRLILDISPEFVTFEGGERTYLQKELK